MFKVGDRVRVYETCPYVGIVEKTENDVAAFKECIFVRGTGNQFGWHHEKQCRRLKPKKRREFWIGVIVDDQEPKHAFLYSKRPSEGEDYIHVREVKKC